MEADSPSVEAVAPTLAEKVEFLRNADAYVGFSGDVVALETHMSWVFLVGDKVFKLKKPVRFPYLDFSTLARREAACRAELKLNRRLAPAVYLDVVPLSLTRGGLSVGGEEDIVDWLVVMRRLDERFMLDRAIEAHSADRLQIARMADELARFYGKAERKRIVPEAHLRAWERDITENQSVLLRQALGLPQGSVRRILRIQRRYLASARKPFVQRVRARRIVDGHGDLRPEHIWLGHPAQIIDCLEFNERLRTVDPFDEIAYLSLECERLGAAWVGTYVAARLSRVLHDRISGDVYSFYRCYRATLRARLAIAHLLEPNPRTPEKWPRRAREYLRIADREAMRLECYLRKREDRPKRGRREGVRSRALEVRPWEE